MSGIVVAEYTATLRGGMGVDDLTKLTLCIGLGVNSVILLFRGMTGSMTGCEDLTLTIGLWVGPAAGMRRPRPCIRCFGMREEKPSRPCLRTGSVDHSASEKSS